MRTKVLIEGFKNTQKFRAIINGVFVGDNQIKDLMNNRFPDVTQRVAVWEALMEIARTNRIKGAARVSGLSKSIRGYDIQVDLV